MKRYFTMRSIILDMTERLEIGSHPGRDLLKCILEMGDA